MTAILILPNGKALKLNRSSQHEICVKKHKALYVSGKTLKTIHLQ